ncbi:hypothetical protein BGZ65_006679 [Modicella reniformis]|uniref:Proteasome activator complex subunit 4 n=1 Tax=Modicella reniformis TaxID=1440133 RepID=A0A9P6LT40_9FUNG|nr:hypothetical protein BGZ65_006679 [Modicella reniformis]
MPSHTVTAIDLTPHQWDDLSTALHHILPYDHDLAQEACDMLKNIIYHFGLCLKTEDWAPGVLYWAKKLDLYLDLNYTLPKETRIAFAKVFWELTVAPGMDITMVEVWCQYCERLIKKTDLIDRKDLTLPWRPIYEILDRAIFPKSRLKLPFSESRRLAKLVRLAEEAQRFFPSEAPAEILEVFLPQMSTVNLSEFLKAQSFLNTFLPTDIESGMDPREWMPAMFRLWSKVAHSSEVDRTFLSLFGRVAQDNVAVKDMFTQEQMRTIYSAGLNSMNLPVGKGPRVASADGDGGGAHKLICRNDGKLGSFVALIVYTINPSSESENQKSSTLTHLRDLIQATESYYHPSNAGSWSYFLSLFLRMLTWEYLKRLKQEELSTCKTPQELLLTPELNNKFAEIVKGVTFLLMFSKDQRAVAQNNLTLRSLAFIAPKLIIPSVLERAYPSLESLTETHRTTSVISALNAIAVPLLNRESYPQGGKHLLPLLHLTVPGVDLNDPVKTWHTLVFIGSILSTVPVKDLTGFGSAGFEWGGMEMDSHEDVDMELEDSCRKASTAEFEEWLMKLLRRIIFMFENYPDVAQGTKSDSVESSVTGTTQYCFETLFGQLSTKLYDRTTKLVIELLESAPLINAGTAMGALIRCWATANRKNGMAKAFPILDRMIRSELEHGASSMPSLAYSHMQTDDSLHYYQGLLNQLLSNSDITEHRAEIISLVKLMLEKCQERKGYKVAAKSMSSALKNMLTIYLKDYRSHDAAQWEDEAFLAESHLHWGVLGEVGSDKLAWHIPSQDEIGFALELIELFYEPSLTRARELMTCTTLEGKQLAIEFCKTITTLKAFIAGMATLVEDDGDSPVSQTSSDDDLTSMPLVKRVNVGYCLTDLEDPRTQRIRKLRAETGQLLHELMVYFRKHHEDDVENIKVLVKTTQIFISDRGIDSRYYEHSKKGHEFLKHMNKLPGDKKIYPRGLRCRRAALQHHTRLKANAYGRTKTEMHDALVFDLTDLSLSQYTDVRKMSQQALLKAIRCFQGAKHLVLPILLNALESSNKDYEKMKGALFLLSSKTLILTCLRDWRYAPDYVLRICMGHHADKPSVQSLLRKCFLEYIMNLSNMSINVIVNKTFSGAVQHFSDHHMLEYGSDTLSLLSIKAKNRRSNNFKAYESLVVSLTDLVKDESLHWRYQAMVMGFLEQYIRPELHVSVDIAQLQTKNLLSEMPAIRGIALSTLNTIMVNIKTRTFAQGDILNLIIRKATNPLKRVVTLPDIVPDDFTRDYLKASVTEIDYDEPEASLLVDSSSTGWLAWPETFKAYLPRTESFMMPEIDAKSRPAFDHLEQFFNQASVWEKMIEFMTEEPLRGEKYDSFNTEHAKLYKSIFGLWEDQFLDQIEPVIVKLCSKTDDKNAQRAATELVGGLVRGSKHWKKSSLDRMWGWLIPVLQKAFHMCTSDSLAFWVRFVKYSCNRRDPRRVLPLITLVFNTPLYKDSTAAFSESKNIYFMRAILMSFSWRVSLLTPSLREDCLGYITHPYKQVREILGSVLHEQFQLTPHPSFKSVSEFLKVQKSEEGAACSMIEALDEKSTQQVMELVQNLEKWRMERPPATQTASDYTNASKTVLSWVCQSLSRFRVQGTYGVVIPLVPELFQMQDIPDDQDLQQLATLTLHQLARFLYPAGMVPTLLDMFCTILKESSSWHVRSNVLQVVQIFFYTNLYSMNVDMMVKVMDAVYDMLLDPQIEVRQLAATTLSGIVRCSQRDATCNLITRFKKLLLATQLPDRKKSDRSGPKGPAPEGYTEALVKRHAGVLGLSSLLEAFPYDVPEWMPGVMVFLADYFSDPPPVSTTVKKVFSDFKRTHQDTWHEDQKQFSHEELEVLTDTLISPSYYA